MESYVIWFVAAFALLAAEMTTGTFYLLVIAIAVACGGVAALTGMTFNAQLLATAIIGTTGTLVLHQWHKRASTGGAAEQSLDVGETVHVETWNDDGTARVYYRGTQWDAALDDAGVSRDATLYIKSTRGSTLILSDRKP